MPYLKKVQTWWNLSNLGLWNNEKTKPNTHQIYSDYLLQMGPYLLQMEGNGNSPKGSNHRYPQIKAIYRDIYNSIYNC